MSLTIRGLKQDTTFGNPQARRYDARDIDYDVAKDADRLPQTLDHETKRKRYLADVMRLYNHEPSKKGYGTIERQQVHNAKLLENAITRFTSLETPKAKKRANVTLLGLKAAFSSGKVSESYKTRYAPIIARFSHDNGTMTMNKIASCECLPYATCECLPYHICEIPSLEMMASQFDDLIGVNIVTPEMTQTEIFAEGLKRGLIISDDGIIVAKITPIDVDAVRPQNPTHKPDGHSMTNTLAWLTKPALAREYEIIFKCYVKRGGVSTQTVYNIIGKRDDFYLLRCPVTGGTIGKLSNDIEVVQ